MENYWWLFWCCNAMMEIMKTMEAPESLSSDRLHNKLRVLVVCALPHLKLWHCLDYLCHCHHLHHRDDFNDDDNDDGHLHGTELDIVLLLLLSSSPPAPLLAHRVEDAVVRPEQKRSCLLHSCFSILSFIWYPPYSVTVELEGPVHWEEYWTVHHSVGEDISYFRYLDHDRYHPLPHRDPQWIPHSHVHHHYPHIHHLCLPWFVIEPGIKGLQIDHVYNLCNACEVLIVQSAS